METNPVETPEQFTKALEANVRRQGRDDLADAIRNSRYKLMFTAKRGTRREDSR